jgi:predicted Zn-dependent protease
VSNSADDKDFDRQSQTIAALSRAEQKSGDRVSRTWDPKEWQEDHRFIEAMDKLAAGYKRDALAVLQKLYKDDPGHLFGRIQLFTVALSAGVKDVIEEHAEWALSFHNQHTSPQIVAESYREIRLALPDLKWSEKSLVLALLAGDKAGDGRVVVDATKMLLVQFPQSRALPRAFLSSADVQLAENRPDLARATLKSLLGRYPLDPLVMHAEKKLAQIDRPSDAGFGSDDDRPSRLFNSFTKERASLDPNSPRPTSSAADVAAALAAQKDKRSSGK